MQSYLWIAMGGALGSVARFWCTSVATRLWSDSFPFGTLLVNVLGSLAIGFFATMTGPAGRWPVAPAGRLFVMTGFCGGFTTFSAFSHQTLELAQRGAVFQAGVNVLGSVLLCLLAVWIGHKLATLLAASSAG